VKINDKRGTALIQTLVFLFENNLILSRCRYESSSFVILYTFNFIIMKLIIMCTDI